MRVLVTNDDGVHAPGLAALTRALAQWAAAGRHEVVVAAPLANHSGASAAVGTVYEREAISYRRVRISGAEDVPAYGLDAPPALAVLAGALGGFGEQPDVVVSGINLGVNVGRSVLHSGTIGATLAGAQLGLRGLAVSLRAGSPPEQWPTAAALAVATLRALEGAPAHTLLSLNVPSVPLDGLRGIRRAAISRAAIVKGAHAVAAGGTGAPSSGSFPEEGEVRLVLGAAIPTLGHLSSDGGSGELHEAAPTQTSTGAPALLDDAVLIASGYATLTPLVGVREDERASTSAVVNSALGFAAEVLGS